MIVIYWVLTAHLFLVVFGTILLNAYVIGWVLRISDPNLINQMPNTMFGGSKIRLGSNSFAANFLKFRAGLLRPKLYWIWVVAWVWTGLSFCLTAGLIYWFDLGP